MTAGATLVCLVLVAAGPSTFLNFSLYYSVGALLGCLVAAQALQSRSQRAQHHAALLSTMRLEVELVKRHLQPHFLMNTLTMLAGLFEESQETGMMAIEALADELRTLNAMSSELNVPLEQEIALCRAHLRLAGFRKDKRFSMSLEGVETKRRVPPAIFHTLVENSLTHNRYRAEEVVFSLSQTTIEDRIRFRFLAPRGEKRDAADPAGAGTGRRYIEARLSESYGSAWRLWSGMEGTDWLTEIEIPAEVQE